MRPFKTIRRGEIRPDKSVRGWCGVEIRVGTKPYWFYFTRPSCGYGDCIFNLSVVGVRYLVFTW